MRSAELLAFGVEGTLSDRLAAWCLDRGLWYRPVQQGSALRNLLRKGSRGVLLVRLGRDLAGELELLRDGTHEFGELTTIVMGDEHAIVEGIAYDLGANAVIAPPRGVEELLEILTLWCAALAPSKEILGG